MITVVPPPNGTDDTPAIQAAINVAKVSGGIVQLQAGDYRHLDLNLRDAHIIFQGVGWGTRLLPLPGTVIGMDTTGAYGLQIRDFKMGQEDGEVEPDCAIFFANPPGEIVSNLIDSRNLFLTGRYRVGALYCVGVNSCSMHTVKAWNYSAEPGACGAVFSKENGYGVLSSFGGIYAESDQSCADWTFTGCEFHDMTPAPVQPVTCALRLLDARDMRFYGGNFGAHGESYVRLGGTCNRLIFDGVAFGPEAGRPPAEYIVRADNHIQGSVYGRGNGVQYSAGLKLGLIDTFLWG